MRGNRNEKALYPHRYHPHPDPPPSEGEGNPWVSGWTLTRTSVFVIVTSFDRKVNLNRIGLGANAVKVLSPEETETPCAFRETGKIVQDRDTSFFVISLFERQRSSVGQK